jgi:serine/threonine protein kinase
MSETHHPALPGGEPNLGDSTTDALAGVGAGDLVALNGAVQSTDDTPTIISRNGPRSGHENANGDLRGRRLAHFELIEPIGVGGMAAVIRARDMQLDRLVALKILPPDMAADPENVRRFHQEARSAARLDHENVARVFFCGEDQRLHFIAFEFVEGDNLRTIMERRGRLPVAEALHYVLQVAAGVAHAAERGVVHRDIKPSNIIITPTGRAKLVDMGLARSLERQDDKGLTQSGVTLGTFDYISPEQALEPREADVRSDIYSLGCTLYHVLTGQPPVPEGTAAKKLHHHHHVKPRDPRELVPGLPDEVAVILDRMMAKKPQDRYQSPEQLVHHLLLSARKLGAPANMPEGMLSVEAALPPPPGGRPLLLTGIAAVMVVALIVLLQVFNRTPAATSSIGPDVAALNSSGNVPDKPSAGGASLAPGPVKAPSDNSNQPTDPPPVVRVARFTGGDKTALLEWLKTVDKDAPKEINLDQDVSLPDDVETGLSLSGPKVTIRSASAGRRPTIRFTHNSRPQGTNPWTAVSIDSPDVTVRGVRILVDGRSADVGMVGLRLRAPAPRGMFKVDNCEFIQARPGRGDKRLESLEVVGDDAAPGDLTLTECRFLSFDGLDNDTLTNQDFGGDDAVVRDGRVKISAIDCAFGPHASLFRLQGGRGAAAPSLSVEHCSMLTAGPGPSAVFNVLAGAAVKLDIRACLISRPGEESADDATAGQAVVIRQADPDGVVCQNRDNRYQGFDAYWIGGDSDQTSWTDFQARTNAIKSSVTAVSPWKGDPLEPLRKYDYKEDPEDYFAAAFQVNPQTPDLRVFASTPVGVRRLGGVNYGDLLAEADRQTAKAQLKRRIVDPTQTSETAKHLYKTLEEALSAYVAGDEIVLRWDGPQPVQPIRLDKQKWQDVTIRPDAGRHPVLRLVAAEDRDSEPALFRVYDGSLKLEGLTFILQPDKGFRRQSVIDLAGQGQCSLKNCLVTLDRSALPALAATQLAVASLSDLGKNMMQPTGPADQAPQLNLDGCFVRGDGDLIDCQTSRPLDLKANNTLVALKGSFLNVEVGPDAQAAAPTGQMTLTLTRATTYLTGNLIHLRAGKDYHTLAPVRCVPTDCLFVAAAKEPQSLVHLDDSDFIDKEAVHDKLIFWGAEGGRTVYGNYGTMLDQTPPGEGMPLTLGSDKWESTWGKDTGKLVKPFRFGPGAPPAPDASFTSAAPLQFHPLDAAESGADVSRLEQTLPPVGSLK